MTRARMLTELKEVIDESTVQNAWAESTLLGYLAEGQDEFCEQTGYFIDFTNYTIVLATGIAAYAMPERAIQILDIWDGTRRLGKFQEQDRAQLTPNWEPDITASQSGRPQRWQTDRETGSITFDRIPTAAENGAIFQLRTWRYSQYALDDETAPINPAEPEIPSRFHRACVEYAAYKALMHHDEEQQDPVKARQHLQAFDDYVLKGKRAMQRAHGLEVRVGTDSAYRT